MCYLGRFFGVSEWIIDFLASLLSSVLRIFGLVGCHDELGFPLEMSPGESNGRTREEMVAPYLDVLAVFRESVRAAAIDGDIEAVLDATDNIRDNVLPDLGVRMEDKGSGKYTSTIWKLDDPEVLRQEKNQRERMVSTRPPRGFPNLISGE